MPTISWTQGGRRRTGEVWSPGPTEDTLWVIPAAPQPGEGHAVCVHRTPGGRYVQRDQDVELSTAVRHTEILAATSQPRTHLEPHGGQLRRRIT